MLPRASRLVTPRNVPSHCFADRAVLTQTTPYIPGVSPSAHRQGQQPLMNKAGDCPRQVTGNKYSELRGGENSFFFIFRLQIPAATRCQCYQTLGRWDYSEVRVGGKTVFQESLCHLHLLCRLAHRSEKSSFDSSC